MCKKIVQKIHILYPRLYHKYSLSQIVTQILSSFLLNGITKYNVVYLYHRMYHTIIYLYPRSYYRCCLPLPTNCITNYVYLYLRLYHHVVYLCVLLNYKICCLPLSQIILQIVSTFVWLMSPSTPQPIDRRLYLYNVSM